MRLPIYHLDAFTSRLFAGNPAAVVLLEDWLPDRLLAAIAAENNLSETAYLIPRSETSLLRWFTPTLEVDLCGHATLAAADVLFRHVFPRLDRMAFSTRSGRMSVTREGEMLVLDFPSRPPSAVAVTGELVAAIGLAPHEALLARDLLIVVGSEADVRSIQPDFGRIAALDAFAVIVSAPGDTVDFVSRFFAPRAGILEDPVTGSAHCTLIPYWANRLGKTRLTARQVSVRGGELECELCGDRVRIGGRVVEYLRGEIAVDRDRRFTNGRAVSSHEPEGGDAG